MSKIKEHVATIREWCQPDIVTGDDGYKVYWPDTPRGYLTSFDLKIIADYLDELNKPWDEEVSRYFNQL